MPLNKKPTDQMWERISGVIYNLKILFSILKVQSKRVDIIDLTYQGSFGLYRSDSIRNPLFIFYVRELSVP